MKILVNGLILSSFFAGFAAYADTAGPDSLESFDVGERPESITVGFDGDFFVSVMGGQEDGDATINRISDGEVTVFATGLNEPKGIAFVGEHLVVSDLDRVMKIDASGEVTVLAGPDDFPSQASYLNDVAADADGNGVYVVDMGDNSNMWESTDPRAFWPAFSPESKSTKRIGRIYHIDMNGDMKTVVEPSELMINPNGVGLDNDGNLLIGAFFNGYLLNQVDGELTILHGNMRGADAVEQDREGNYYVSSWNQGKLWKIAADGSATTLAEGFASAADFYLDDENNVIYLPDMLAGKVYRIDL